MTTQGLLRTLRRQVRKLWRRLRPPALQFVYDRRYESSVSGLPWDPLRADRILTFLSMEGLIGRSDMRRPKAVSMKGRLIQNQTSLPIFSESSTSASRRILR